ncbi:MAG: hypothetical protein H0U03_09695 [Actinobacteria bacterium]|nr:hypothetical protein [Actinomycetota bacterium]
MRTALSQAASEWLAAAQAGIVRTRSGERYKPSALRAYEQALRTRVLPELGHVRPAGVSVPPCRFTRDAACRVSGNQDT